MKHRHNVDRVYVRSVLGGLRQLLAAPDGEGAADTLRDCIRVLTTLESSWDESGDDAAPDHFSTPGRYGHYIPDGPPECAAVRSGTSQTIGDAAALIESTYGGILVQGEKVQEMLAWENRLAAAAIEKRDNMEMARAANSEPGNAPPLNAELAQSLLRVATGIDTLKVVSFRSILGGRSRQTAMITVSDAPGVGPDLVMQMPLPGVLQFSGPEVEHKVLSRLHSAGLKVPPPVLYKGVEDDLSPPFLVTGAVEGAAAEKNYFSPIRSSVLALGLAQQMAMLHSIPVDEFEGVLSRPDKAEGRKGLLDELDAFAASWHANAHAPSVAVSAALAYLRANVDVVQPRLSLVHNDMVFHNILAEDGEVSAILDWEQCALGHPGEDLGYCYPFIAPHTSWDEYVEHYRAAGGAHVSQQEIDFFAIRAIIRIMIVTIEKGRIGFEAGVADDVFRATVGTHFLQRLLLRLGRTLSEVLARSGSATPLVG